MKDLIEALTIMLKYLKRENARGVTHCSHDQFSVVGVPQNVSAEDAERLEELGFFWDEQLECWSSFRFGSA